MEMVVIGGQYKRIASYIEANLFEDMNITITNVVKPRIYLEVHCDVSFQMASRQIKRKVMSDPILSRAFFEIYPIFEGKVDFASYLSPEKKRKLAYYREVEK